MRVLVQTQYKSIQINVIQFDMEKIQQNYGYLDFSFFTLPLFLFQILLNNFWYGWVCVHGKSQQIEQYNIKWKKKKIWRENN